MSKVKEIVIIGKKGSDLEKEIFRVFLPSKVVVLSENAQADAEFIPLLRDRGTIDGKPTAYVCEDFVCQRPVTTADELKGQLG